MSFPINVQFGKKIKELRLKRGITQEELAEKAKTSYKYIQRIEGRTPPDIRLSTMEKIANALQVRLSKIFN